MSDETGIEWADSTFNPWMGCTKVSPACDHCYAERDTKRFGRVQWGAGQPRVRTSAGNWKKPLQWNAQPFVECPVCGWRGEWREADVRNGCCPNCNHLPRLFKPARRRVFCASLADVFDNDVDPAWRSDLFDLIERTPNLDWMLLTKRIGNVAKMVTEGLFFPSHWPNVWIGATICNQEEAERDIPKLLAVPAAVRFLSVEPMLGRIDLCETFGMWWNQTMGCFESSRSTGFNRNQNNLAERAIDWVIVGGESGSNARPMHPDWARSLRDQCAAAGVPFLFKQWGEWAPREPYASECMESDELCGKWDGVSYRYGKKAAGRLLDGMQYDGYPA